MENKDRRSKITVPKWATSVKVLADRIPPYSTVPTPSLHAVVFPFGFVPQCKSPRVWLSAGVRYQPGAWFQPSSSKFAINKESGVGKQQVDGIFSPNPWQLPGALLIGSSNRVEKKKIPSDYNSFN